MNIQVENNKVVEMKSAITDLQMGKCLISLNNLINFKYSRKSLAKYF